MVHGDQHLGGNHLIYPNHPLRHGDHKENATKEKHPATTQEEFVQAEKPAELYCLPLSKHQGKIDWETVSQDGNIQFVYIKATEGASLVDKRYERNIKEARKAGMTVGSYHFFNTRRSAAQQFENFRKHVRKDWQDLIPMVDVEESGCRGASRQQLQQSLSEFMELMKSEYGKYPLLYSQYRFYNEKLAPEFNRFFIFMARYSETEPTLRGKGKYNIWQYSERGHVKGIKENVDLDRFANGTSLKDILY